MEETKKPHVLIVACILLAATMILVLIRHWIVPHIAAVGYLEPWMGAVIGIVADFYILIGLFIFHCIRYGISGMD